MKQQLDRRSERARLEAEAARARIIATLSEIRRRIDPRTIASETAHDLLDRVNNQLGQASSAAKSRPWLVAVGATLVGVALTYRARMTAEDGSESSSKQPNSPGKVDRRTKEI
jgi:ElaB/YqjD/DUF883 family membrane-anchored ribosome-binding protein